MEPVIAFDGVTKMYGAVIGLNHVSCRVGAGITGLFGSNGAGKSTFIKLASGQLKPSQGKVEIGPYDAWTARAKAWFGYSPDIDHFYEDMTAQQFVETMALIHGFPWAEARARTAMALERVGMADRQQRRMAGCSRGMRQRVKLAQALLHDPPVLLLDEPMTGIDPGGRREMNALLIELAEAGKTILMSSHILGEVEHLADSILMIARGRLVASGSIPEIRELLKSQPLVVELGCEPPRAWAAALIQAEEVQGLEIRGDRLRIETNLALELLARIESLVLERGMEIHQVTVLDGGAEAVFRFLDQGAP